MRRIVEAGDTERRRIERDLHDGAQQRLVSLSLALGVAKRALGPVWGRGSSSALSTSQLKKQARHLRSSATWPSGVHPLSKFTEGWVGRGRGVARGLNFGRRGGRYRLGAVSPAVEGAAYFVVSEASANVTKYARATKATVRVRGLDDHLSIEMATTGSVGPTLVQAAGSAVWPTVRGARRHDYDRQPCRDRGRG